MIRTVPCMAGWDGPMLTVMSSLGSSCSSSRSSRFLRPRTSFLSSAMAPLLVRPLAPDQRLAPLLGVVLAERMADELVVHVDAAQVRVAGERDPVHVVGLAFEP